MQPSSEDITQNNVTNGTQIDATDATIKDTMDVATKDSLEATNPTNSMDASIAKEIDNQTILAPFERDAAATVDDITIGWNLGNTLDAFIGTSQGLSSETCWGNPKATKELIDLLKASGFNAIRVPVTWGTHMDKDNNIDEAWLDRVEEVVSYVLDNEMYCILNSHHDTGTSGWLRASRAKEDEMREKFVALWTQVSSRFCEANDKLLFESFNEILTDDNQWGAPPLDAMKVVNELNQLFVDTVRKTGGNNDRRCLIVNTYAASTDTTVLGNFKLPTDTIENRLIAEAHVYAPFQFTHEDYPSVTDFSENEVKSSISPLMVKLGIQKIPVIIGEFGCADKKNLEARVNWTKFFVETALKYNIKCFWWDNGVLNQYAIIDRKNLSVSQPEIVDAMMSGINK